MVKGCHKIASHKIPIGKYGVFWGNYEIATNGEMNNLMVCEIHMKADTMRHPWSQKSQTVLSVIEKECALCKTKVGFTNGKEHCVKHMVAIAGKSSNVSCNYFDQS